MKLNKPLKYAQLILETWPKVRDILRIVEKEPKGAPAIDAAIAILVAIVRELDGVGDDRTLAQDASSRIAKLARGFGNDPAVDAALDTKFPKG